MGLDGSGLGVAATQGGIYLTGATGAVVRNNVVVAPGDLGPFSGNGHGIVTAFQTSELVIDGNRLGVDPVGDGVTVGLVPFGVLTGLNAEGTTDVQFGDPQDASTGNLIAGATFFGGVFLTDTVRRIRLSGTRMPAAATASVQAIDLTLPTGPNANDPLDADTGSNERQNHPELLAATTSGAGTQLGGSLHSLPATTFRIEVFAGTGCGNGSPARGLPAWSVASFDVTTNGAGDATFAQTVPAVPAGRVLSATATDPVGNTSEMSPCRVVTGGPVPGALRFTAARYPVAENHGAVQLVVERIGGSDGAVSVRVASEDATALAGSDYQAVDTVLTWAAGVGGTQTVPVPVLFDLVEEGREHFVVRLREPGGGAALGPLSGTVVPITHVPDVILASDFES